MTRVLQARVASLLAGKDEAGLSYRRGRFSTRFIPGTNGGWQVVFHQETAKPDRLLVERLRLDMARDDHGRWSIVHEHVDDTYDGLVRSIPGDEEFFAFDGFSLEREGLSVRGGAGFLSKGILRGKPERIILRAAQLAYTYQPPLEIDRVRHALMVEDHPGDFVFTPEEVEIWCDAATCGQVLAKAFRHLRPASEDEVDEELLRSCDELMAGQQEDRRKDPFDGFDLPDEADRRRISVLVKRADRDHWLDLDVDSAEPNEVTFWVSGYDTVHSYPSEASRARVSAIDLERRPDFDRRDFDVEGLEGSVNVGFGDGQVLSGDITVKMRLRRALRELPFSFARFSPVRKAAKEVKHPRLVIDELEDGEGRDLTWVATGPSSALALFPAPMPANSLVSLHVAFENRDCVYKFTPYYYYVAREGWLPFVSPGDMIQSFDLTVSVPAKFEALGVGTRSSESRNGQATVTRWTSREAVNFPTVIFGGYKDAVSKVKVAKKDGTEIPVVTHVDRDSLSSITSASSQSVADQAAQTLELYQKLFATDYPFGKLDLVNDPGEALAGQAPSSLIFIGSAAPRFRRGPGQPTPSEIERFRRSLVPHEVAHQWWGSMVASTGPRHQWFEEALAEYSAGLYFQAASGLEEYLTLVQDWRKEAIETQMLVPVQDAYILLADDDAMHASLYAKGPYIFHMMRSLWGDDRFFAFLKALARERKGTEIVTRDLQRLAETSFGEKLDWFFDQWVRGVGIPEFTLKQTTRVAENGEHILEGTVRQRILVSPRLKPRRVLEGKAFECAVYLTVTGRSGKEYQKRLDLSGPTTTFTMTVPEKPRSIVLNKYGETLAHDVIVSDGP